MIGLGARHMLEQGFTATGGIPGGDFERLYRELLRFYEAHIAVHSRPFPGLIAALDRLDALGVKYRSGDQQARGYGAQAARRARAGGEDGDHHRRRHARAGQRQTLSLRRSTRWFERCGGGRAAFVGDSIYDVMAANSAGVTSIAVSFGFLDRPADELGANHVIEHFDELVPLLTRL